MAEDKSQDERGDDGPRVADWAKPTPKETRGLLRHDPGELAQLAINQPALAGFLALGFDTIKDVWSGELASNAEISEAYFSLTARTIDGLLQRLDKENVSDEEQARIYGLIESLQGQSGEKASEILSANAKSAENTRLLMGALIALGLSVAAAVYFHRGPQPPSPGL